MQHKLYLWERFEKNVPFHSSFCRPVESKYGVRVHHKVLRVLVCSMERGTWLAETAVGEYQRTEWSTQVHKYYKYSGNANKNRLNEKSADTRTFTISSSKYPCTFHSTNV